MVVGARLLLFRPTHGTMRREMRKTLEAIDALKRQGVIRDYAIGGAVAALKWVEPFFTRDLDIFVIPVHGPQDEKIVSFLPIYEFLKTNGYDQWTGQWLMIEGIPVEFLPADGLAREAVEQAVETEFEGVRTRVATPEYLIALFLKASRDKDKMKIGLLLDQTAVDRKKLETILKRHGLEKTFRILQEEKRK